MPQRLQAFIACATLVAAPDMVAAQSVSRSAVPIALRASAAAGSVHGTVRDDIGQVIGGVSIVALGATLELVQSDGEGRFALALPPGEYILRASHTGYVSTFREPVRVQTSARLERDITLVRAAAAASQPLISAPGQPAAPTSVTTSRIGPHAHSELAWRLRHLRRTILRDASPASGGFIRNTDIEGPAGRGSLFDRALLGSARAAASFFSNTEFTGQVNILTSSSLTQSTGWRPEPWSHGVALVALGAPVGPYGDWNVRGAVKAGDLSSWVLQGEYLARPEMAHAVHLGMSYSVQGDQALGVTRRPLTAETRSVGAVFGYDRWRISPAVALEYGVRLDRYDYVPLPDLVSPRVGVAMEVLANTRVTASAARHVVAPGATEFLPPTSNGLWLPPERTFSTLSSGETFRAERVLHFEVGLERDFDVASHSMMIGLRRFRQFAENQGVTLFGVNRWRPNGHYRVATNGDVNIDGWGIRLGSEIRPGIGVEVEYAIAAAAWRPTPGISRLARLAPSAARSGAERLHDLTMRVEARIPESDTSVSFAYRASSAFARARDVSTVPATHGRFDVEVHQGLPYHPMPGSRLEVLLAIRNLFRDPRAEGSLYDELLTIAPPLRLMGGVRIRF